MHMGMPAAALALAATLALSGETHAKTLQIDISACATNVHAFGQPVGTQHGNAGTELSNLKFTLLDPGVGNNVWIGTAGSWMDINLSITGASKIYTLMNTLYGQGDIPNATVILKGAGGVSEKFNMVGNKTIRDFNNFTWTNTINGTNTQVWWTDNLNPTPQDLSKRLDVRQFKLSDALRGSTLTHIIVRSPDTAADNFMRPFLAAANVVYSGTSGPVTCALHSPS